MQTIGDDEIDGRLRFDNPWWRIGEGTVVRFRRPPERSFLAPFAAAVRAQPPGRPLVLAGPLRAGKTVMIRQAIQALIEAGTPPGRILYCPWSTPSLAVADSTRIVDRFMALQGAAEGAETHVFLDEAQYVPNWQAALAKLAERHPQARVTAAVSALAPGLVAGSDLFVLPPLTFAEFLRLRGSEDAILDGAAREGQVALSAGALSALESEFHRYVNFGGFPEGVIGSGTGQPAPTFVRDGVPERVLHKDLAGLSGINDMGELNRLFALIALNTGAELAMEDLAKATGIAKNTLRKYLDHLEHAFLIRRLPRVDKQARRFQRAVAFKAYLTAPCLHTALYGPVAADHPAFPRLAETALAAQWLGRPEMANVHYASWRGGGVDLLTIDPKSHRPDRVFELDWTDTYGPGGAVAGKGPKALVQFADATGRDAKAYVLTRRSAYRAAVGGRPLTIVPLALYAYWIERGIRAGAA